MLKINKLLINIFTTDNKTFSASHDFHENINIIGSINNTKGKSSFLQGVYYCLGIEELIGGKKEVALSPVFKSKILDNLGKEHSVYQSYFYLEIENENGDVYTLERCANNKDRDSNLITIANCKYEDFDLNKHLSYYVNLSGSYESSKGFHKWLSKFIGYDELPKVPNTSGIETKLYLQLIFAPFFVEQKIGWSNYLSNIPHYSIIEVKKRVLEFILNLSKTNDNKKIEKLKIEEKSYEKSIEDKIVEIKNLFQNDQVEILNLNNFYKNAYTPDWNVSLRVNYLIDNETFDLNDYVSYLNAKIFEIDSKNFEIKSNLSNIQSKIEKNQKIESQIRANISDSLNRSNFLKAEIKLEQETKEKLELEIANLTDIIKLKKLGSNVDSFIVNNTCPTCKQDLNNNTLETVSFLDLDQSLNHYKAQLELINYTIENNANKLVHLENELKINTSKLKTIQKLLHSQISDIYTPNESLSYSLIKEKVLMENKINLLEENDKKFKELVAEMDLYYNQLDKIKKQLQNVSQKLLGSSDDEKIKYFSNKFKENLSLFGFTSVDIRSISITEKTLTPNSFDYDLRIASSASDNIRAMWAYYLSLQQTCIKYDDTRSLNLFLFDDPVQQSAKRSDFHKFLTELQKLNNTQIIMGMTLDEQIIDQELSIVKNCDKNSIIENGYIFKEFNKK